MSKLTWYNADIWRNENTNEEIEGPPVVFKEEWKGVHRKLIVDGCHGIHVPKYFAFNYPELLTDEQKKILKESEDELYWETWQEVLEGVSVEAANGEGVWLLRQDGDLFAELEISYKNES